MITFFFLLSIAVSFLSQAKCQSAPSNLQGLGEWQLLQEDIGISAMHMQLLHNNKVVMFDRTDFGPSNLSLPDGRCRHDPSDTALQTDCTAHSIIYDIATNSFRPLMVDTDTWCSSGSVLSDGMLVQTGGYNDGDRVVRTFTPCDSDNCDWIEYPSYLSERRWYATNQILPDGRVIIVGGRRVFNYEFFPRSSGPYTTPPNFWLNFLVETRDYEENNLYPFVHLLPDGNLFIFANTRAISLDYIGNTIVREFPPITDGGPRNYPSSGSSVLLPIDENKPNIEADILVCGGSQRGAFTQATTNRVFLRATSTCARLRVTDVNATWVMEDMPTARTMGDMLLLPNGDVLILNGAELGTAGWENAANPITTPVIYQLHNANERFRTMSPSPRPRMYHSAAILLTDGRVLVGGSNPHIYYNFTNIEFPTDLSLEAYSPPYLSTGYGPMRPNIIYGEQVVGYGLPFSVTFNVQQYEADDVVSVNIIAPSFTTHSLAMNQRMVILRLVRISQVSTGMYNVGLLGPSTTKIAPPGYYLLFVVHAGIPSPGMWLKVQ